MPLTAHTNFLRAVVIFCAMLHFAYAAPAQTNSSCADTSYRIQFFAPGKDLTVSTYCNTSDGGTVVLGRSVDISNPALSNIILIKLDAFGQIAWKKLLSNIPANGSNFPRIIELTNGNIVAFGYTTHYNSPYKTRMPLILQFTSGGNLEWSKKLLLISHFDSLDILRPYFISEGLNHDLLFTIAGWHIDVANNLDSCYSIMGRMDKTGRVVWSKAFTNKTSTWFISPSGIYEVGGEVLTLGHVDYGYLCIYGFKMNYKDGQPDSVKSYWYFPPAGDVYSGGDGEERWGFNSIKQTDSKLSLFGRLTAFDSREYSYKMLLDKNLNMLLATQYSVPNSNTGGISRMSVLPDGSSHLYWYAGTASTLYWASLDSVNKTIRQRKLLISDAGNYVGGSIRFGYRNSSTYNFATNYNALGRRYTLFTQIQRNDPSIDSCLGTDTIFTETRNLPFTATNWSWSDIIDNPMLISDFPVQLADFTLEKENVCSQISVCDSLHIIGPDKVCDISSFVQFTSQKNPGCYKRVLWETNSEFVDSLYQPNDSSLLVRFKRNQTALPKSVTLYASAADCTVAKDTMVITLMPPLHQLPNDTTYCQPFTTTLSVGLSGKNYLWQDGSTDSVLQVSQPGTYWVRAESFCGEIFFDTTVVKMGPSTAFELGADTSICEGQFVVLHAQRSLQSFHWNDGSSRDSILISKKGLYWLSGLDSAGCGVKDSIQIIEVYPKPDLKILPASQVFCIGQNDTLLVNEAFEKFIWSDGSGKNFLPVVATGKYWLEVTDANGCVGSDTVTVQKLSMNPQNFLPADTVVCKGKAIMLTTLQSFVKYEWGNGATSPIIELNQSGLLTLQVIDKDGCKGVDSIKVMDANCQNKIFFPSAFTPNNDGLNDVFKPSVQGELQSFRLMIFNRWGQAVFTESNYQNGWNGLLQSKPQPVGSYVWTCYYQFAGEENKMQHGIFVLVR